MNENKQLIAVYNGNETIINAGFTMQSNYILPVLSRMVDEKLLNKSGMEVVQAILSFKHTEENPYPTRETIALYLGKTVDYVKKALKSIKEAGILAIEKSGRKSTYSFKPFFALLEKFIVEFKINKNFAVKIAELLKVKVQKKESKTDFSKLPKGEKQEVVAVEPPVEEVPEEVVPVLPEEITTILSVYGISKEGIEAVEKTYTAYNGKLQDAVFIEKIVASKDKKEFVKYYEKCITTAYINGEEPKQAPASAPKQNNGGYAPNGVKIVRKEIVPNWFDEEPKHYETFEEQIDKASEEELDKIEASVQHTLDLVPNNKSALEHMKLIKERKEALAGFDFKRGDIKERLAKFRESK